MCLARRVKFYTNQKRREMSNVKDKNIQVFVGSSSWLMSKSRRDGLLTLVSVTKKQNKTHLSCGGDLKILQANNIIYFSHIYLGLSFEL